MGRDQRYDHLHGPRAETSRRISADNLGPLQVCRL
jgi:hypothetical protein